MEGLRYTVHNTLKTRQFATSNKELTKPEWVEYFALVTGDSLSDNSFSIPKSTLMKQNQLKELSCTARVSSPSTLVVLCSCAEQGVEHLVVVELGGEF